MSGAALELAAALRETAHPLTGSPHDIDELLWLARDARYVLLGEASHGTHEFYRERAEITKRLIREGGFNAVAVEADWPDAARVNDWVRGRGRDQSANEALRDFRRFPAWMWRNRVVADFAEWLRSYNDNVVADELKVGFFGLDLYSLRSSMQHVLDYLDGVDKDAGRRARERYACFDHLRADPESYGYAASSGLAESCEDDVVKQLFELRAKASEYASRDGAIAEDDHFFAEQNARLVRSAEEYYRAMFRGRASTWNLRDRHMVETLEALVAHLDRGGGRSKVIVWAHNSHLGDARATEMGDAGELNVGELLRRRHAAETLIVGFTTYSGTVTAASSWDGPAERMRVLPALDESYEALFHQLALPRFLLTLSGDGADVLREPRLERAIGVIYRPETERRSHYFEARLREQFDAVIHFDETQAVEPLEKDSGWEAGELPDTYPFGI